MKARKTLTLTLNQRCMLWVIASLVISMLPQLNTMPLHLVSFTLLPVAWRIMAELRSWKPVPMLLRVIATLLSVITLWATYDGLTGRRAAVSMLALMLSLKLLETFKTRDARIVTSLSLFLCGTQFLFSQGIPMIAYIIACVLSSLIALMHLQRREAWDNLGAAPDNGHRFFAELGFGLRLLAVAVPIGLVLFLFFPRWSSPLWGIPEDALDARSGLSDSMSPGSIQSLFMDDSPAFRATFQGGPPANAQLYWRGPVFWQFDGTRWEAGFMSMNLLAETRPDPVDSPFRYRVQMEPTEQKWLFALDYPALVPPGAKLTMDYQLLARRPVTRLREYLMASDPVFSDSPRLRPTLRDMALELPAGFNPRTLEMMDQWRTEAETAEELVRRALTHFNREQFRYTLNPPLLSRNTVDEFLFDTREGFCEHYASAFTVMMRMAGIPARVVTGYQGGWYNEIGSYVLVRQSDAHAWSEVWLDGQGWVRVDPTAAVAPSRVERGAMDSLADRRYLLDYEWIRSVRNTFDLFQRGWNNWVVAFSSMNQSRLFSAFGWDSLNASKLVIMMITGILVISTFIFFLAPFLLKYRLNRTRDPVMRLWQGFVRKLQRSGFQADPSSGPLEMADKAGEHLPGQRDDIINIARLYVLCRYADDDGHRADLAERVKQFKPRYAIDKAEH